MRTLETRQKISEGMKRANLEGRHQVWNKGLTKETNPSMKIISDKLKGRELSEEHYAKVLLHLNNLNTGIPWNKGKKCPQLSVAFKGRKVSKETRVKNSQSHLGKNLQFDWSDLNELYTNQKLSMCAIAKLKGCSSSSVETHLRQQNITIRNRSESFNPLTLKNLKLSKSKRQAGLSIFLDCEWCKKEMTRRPSELKKGNHYFCSLNCKAHYFGDLQSKNESYKQLMRELALKNGNIPPLQQGENHYNWKGGITPSNRLIRASGIYKNWRTNIFIKDDFVCQICGERGHHLNAHHIYPMNAYPDDYLDESNGMTLCVHCHDYVHHIFGDA